MKNETADHLLLMILLGAVITLFFKVADLKKTVENLRQNSSEGGENKIMELQAEP